MATETCEHKNGWILKEEICVGDVEDECYEFLEEEIEAEFECNNLDCKARKRFKFSLINFREIKCPIQTQTFQGGWVNCQHKSWSEIKEDGWIFEYATPEGYVVMSKNGYLNVFRANPKSEKSPK